MEQSPFWEPNSHSTTQEIPPVIELEGTLPCSQEPATGPTLNLMNSLHTFPRYFPKIHSNIIFPPMHMFPNRLFPSGFPTKIL
jgi:hypothetical protein